MSLIKCPECGSDVSDQAASCPQCGYPVQSAAGVSPTPPIGNDLDALVRKTLLEEGKIAAIKLYRERTRGVGLAQAKEHVERIEATVAPGSKTRSKSSGCLGVAVVVVASIGILLAIYI